MLALWLPGLPFCRSCGILLYSPCLTLWLSPMALHVCRHQVVCNVCAAEFMGVCSIYRQDSLAQL